jgi:uncharacterized protein (DUF305 family)
VTPVPRRLFLFAFAALTAVGTQSAQAQGNDPIPPTAAAPGRYPYTAADVAFMTGMIGHHAQAIVMAKWAPTHGADKSIKILCERIINAQQDEITLMQQWLRDRNQPVPAAEPMQMAPGMTMAGMAEPALMPGMLTPAQMTTLEKSRGHTFDSLFLVDMIQHHTGAVEMVTRLFNTPGAGQDEGIFKLASDVNVDQTTEINRMTLMLNSLPRK